MQVESILTTERKGNVEGVVKDNLHLHLAGRPSFRRRPSDSQPVFGHSMMAWLQQVLPLPDPAGHPGSFL